MKPRIAVVGSINMDLVFRVERMPRAGETIQGGGLLQTPGGKGANQAVAAARQGAEVSLIGCLGEDAFGVRLRSCLTEVGLDTTHLSSVPNAASGVAAILLEREGGNSIVLAPGANNALTVGHIMAAAQMIAAASYLVCQLETPLETVVRAIEIAHRSGTSVILNAAPVQAMSAGLLHLVDYLIVNETEASQLSGVEVTNGDTALFAARKLLKRGGGTVLLTMGEHGVLFAQQDVSKFIPAIPVQVVDTTAAGDTFVGAFAVALARGLSAFDAASEAQFAAALAVTKLGAQSSIPFRSEVELFMKARMAYA